MKDWIPLKNQAPKSYQKVEWIAPSGEVVRGSFAGGCVWFPEGSTMYVYYTPVFWRPLDA